MKPVRKILRIVLILSAFVMLATIAETAIAEPVVNITYTFLDYSGEFTGQADSNHKPFGFGV